MDINALTGLIDNLGMAGIFVVACWYLMKRMEAKEEERAKESREREARMLESLTEADKSRTATETYIRNTQALAIEENSKCSRELAYALERLPCMALRAEDIKQVLHDRRRTGKDKG